MGTFRTGLAVLGGLAVGLAACGGGENKAVNPPATTSRNIVFDVNLDGLAAVPGPGAIDGAGRAKLIIDPLGTEVCYTLEVSDIGTVTATHIHEGRPGRAGPIAVTLKNAGPAPTQCIATTSSIIKGLTSGIRAFYIDVHTDEFPQGAVRAQLKE